MEEIQAVKDGQIIAKRWRVLKKLGEGGMGAVFQVSDTKINKTMAALKVEADISDGGVIKLEVNVLKTLEKFTHAPRLYDCGETGKYCFMAMTLMGPDLMALKREAGVPRFSESTTLHLSMATLYAIKILHEAGWTHRDIKPGNCVTGLQRHDRKMVYLIDYGMVRSFLATDSDTGRRGYRKARPGEQLFRGTPRYCSMNVHNRKEQGRVDDLWSWLYMMIELHQGLPWRRLTDEKEIADAKQNCSKEALLKGCPKEFGACYDYLTNLPFSQRPDYHGLYSEIAMGFKRVSGNFFGQFEWEVVRENKEKEENEKKGIVKTSTHEEPQSVTEWTPTRKTDDYRGMTNKIALARKIWPYADGKEFKKKYHKY